MDRTRLIVLAVAAVILAGCASSPPAGVAPAKEPSDGVEAHGCSIDCGGGAASVTCRQGYRAVCDCANPDRIAYCVPAGQADG